jgi:hypothetical protein
MSIENLVLVSNYSDNTSPTDWKYSNKQKGAGYHTFNDGLHTIVFQFNDFVGNIKIQATLALYPGEDDWADVVYDTTSVDLLNLDNVTNAVATFTGKVVWIRAAYRLEQGTITEIRYNY